MATCRVVRVSCKCRTSLRHVINLTIKYGQIGQRFASLSHANKTSRRFEERFKEDKSINQSERRVTRKQPLSAEDRHIRNALSKCKSNQEIIHLLSKAYACTAAQTLTVSVFTKAIQMVTKINHHTLKSAHKTLDDVEVIWQMMENCAGDDIDHVAYSALFKAYLEFRHQKRVKRKFTEMINRGIMPNEVILDNVLSSTKAHGDVSQAIEFWDIIVNRLQVKPNIICYKSFLSVCAKGRDVKTAEKWFADCPFRFTQEIASEMMDVYARTQHIEKMEQWRHEMEHNAGMQLDESIYNAMILGYLYAGNASKAIETVREAMCVNQHNLLTIKHYLSAYLKLIQEETDWFQREKYLKYVEWNIAEYFEQCGQNGRVFLKSAEWADRMLDAYFHAYKDTFGKRTFEELNEKYGIQYWDDSGNFDIPTLCLYPYDVDQSKFLLRYVMEAQLDMVRDCGFNVLISLDNSTRSRWRTQAKVEDIQHVLQSLKLPLTASLKSKMLIHVSAEEIQKHKAALQKAGDDETEGSACDDEPLFGFSDDDE